MICIASVWN